MEIFGGVGRGNCGELKGVRMGVLSLVRNNVTLKSVVVGAFTRIFRFWIGVEVVSNIG